MSKKDTKFQFDMGDRLWYTYPHVEDARFSTASAEFPPFAALAQGGKAA